MSELGALKIFVANNFKRDHKSESEALLSAAGEVCEEAGELFGELKKYCYYDGDKNARRDKIKSELHDVLATLMNVVDLCGFDPTTLVEDTISDLRAKWPKGFSPKRGRERHEP